MVMTPYHNPTAIFGTIGRSLILLSACLAVCGCGEKSTARRSAPVPKLSSAEAAPLIRQAAALCQNPDDVVDLMKAPMSGQKWVKLTKDIQVWPDATMNAYVDVRLKAGPNDGGEIYFERHAVRRDWQNDHNVKFVIDGRIWQPKSTIMADNIKNATAETVRVKVSLAQLSLIVTAEVVEVHVGQKSAVLTAEQRKPLAGLMKMWMREAGAH